MERQRTGCEEEGVACEKTRAVGLMTFDYKIRWPYLNTPKLGQEWSIISKWSLPSNWCYASSLDFGLVYRLEVVSSEDSKLTRRNPVSELGVVSPVEPTSIGGSGLEVLLSEDSKLTRSDSSLDQNWIRLLTRNSFLFGLEMVAVAEIEKYFAALAGRHIHEVVEWSSGTPREGEGRTSIPIERW